MPNLLDRFKRSNVGNYNKPTNYDDIIDPIGDFKKLKGLEAIVRSWKTILTTPVRTYDHDPEFGSELPNYVFAPRDQETAENIQTEVEDSLKRFDNRADIEEVKVSFLNKGFLIEIVANYQGESFSIKQPIDESTLG